MNSLGLFEKSTYGAGNRLVYSNLNEFDEAKMLQHHVGIKYVIEGCETYFLNKREFQVKGGQYLLINPAQVYSAHVHSESEVKGICLNLDTNIISDVFKNFTLEENELLDDPGFISAAALEVFEGIYDASECPFGSFISDIATNIENGDFGQPSSFDLFCDMSAKLLSGQKIIQRKVCQINARQWSTKKELYKRVEHGKQIIENTFCRTIDVESIASESCLSPFHFSRTFKQVYGLSPYQYMISKRIELAKLHLQSDNYSISEIAGLTGFADIHSFSKAFRKAQQQSPTEYKKLVT